MEDWMLLGRLVAWQSMVNRLLAKQSRSYVYSSRKAEQELLFIKCCCKFQISFHSWHYTAYIFITFLPTLCKINESWKWSLYQALISFLIYTSFSFSFCKPLHELFFLLMESLVYFSFLFNDFYLYILFVFLIHGFLIPLKNTFCFWRSL